MKVKQVKDKYAETILKKANVVGVGIGKKFKDGKYSDELSIRVYVQSKTSLSRLSDEDIVEKEYDSIKTDVIAIGRVRLQGLRDKNRPTQGGDSIGGCHSLQYNLINAGTLGVALIDKTDGSRVLLSNNHVLADMDSTTESRANQGDIIVQPGTLDGGHCNNDAIGTLKRWIPYDWNGNNEVDAAIADLNTESDAIECTLTDIGKVEGIRQLTEDDIDLKVQKIGRTTGYTTGTVQDVDVTIDIGVPVPTATGIDNRIITFTNQILFSNMSDAGDSGSLILDMNKKAVALLFAGSDIVTIGNRIEKVLDYLDLEFCPTIQYPFGGPMCPGGPIEGPLCPRCGPYEGPLCPRYGPYDGPFCIRGGPMCPGGPIEGPLCPRYGPYEGPLCPRGGPRIIQCIVGGPDSPCPEGPIIDTPLCPRGGPRIIQCIVGGPDTPCPGGPRLEGPILKCPAGPLIPDCRAGPFYGPDLDPGDIYIIDPRKIPRGMKKAFNEMVKKMNNKK